jgi:hypothetical protein
MPKAKPKSSRIGAPNYIRTVHESMLCRDVDPIFRKSGLGD